MKFHVRKYNFEDRYYVLDIDNKSYDHPWSLDLWSEISGMIYVCESSGRVVGFSVVRMNECWIEILRFAVTPGYRKLGIGSLLLKYVESEFPMAVGVKTYSFDIEPMIFLKKNGFRFIRKSGNVYILHKDLLNVNSS